MKYLFKMQVKAPLCGGWHEKTIEGDLEVTDQPEGDPDGMRELPMVARYLIKKIAEEVPEIMGAAELRLVVRRPRGKAKKR